MSDAAVPGDPPILVPTETGIGTIPLVNADGSMVAVAMRVSDGPPVLDVAWPPDIARKVAIELLRIADSQIPLEPQHDAVLLRAPGGTNPLAAVKEVAGAMFETGPADVEGLRLHIASRHESMAPLDLRNVAEDTLRALHRADHAEGRRHE